MSAPFMQLYVGDYLRDTRHLTAEQHGAYLLLLMAMWNADGTLPNDHKKLARLASCTPTRWSKISADVMAFFEVDGDTVTNRRLSLELKKASEKSIKRAIAGRAGVAAKSMKSLVASSANDGALLKHSSEPEPEYSSEDKSSDAVRVVVDHDRDAWNQAVTLLTGQGGMKAEKARPFFGRLLRDNGLEARDLLPSISKATVSGTQDPQGYLTRAAQAVAKRRSEPAKPKRVGWV